MTYLIPTKNTSTEIIIKRSRFIARANKATTRQDALAFVQQAKRDFADARHHCWAYILGNPTNATSAAMNDDGEPSGTAGKPILNVIQHKGIGDVVVVVTRYFGGIKLGAGGLVRAYSNATEAAMSLLPTEQAVAMQRLELSLDFSQEQLCRHWATQHEAVIQQVNYNLCVNMTIDLPLVKMEVLRAFCLSRGINLRNIEE